MPIRIIGLDWRGGKYVHPFDLVDIPQRPGIYKLHEQQPDGEWVVFYVGETQNLYETLVAPMTVDAESDPRIRARLSTGQCAYSYAELPDADERAAALRTLYEYYEPALNDPGKIPGSDLRIEVNPN